jgi:hypothetical protein
MRYYEIIGNDKKIIETASPGSSSAGNVATVVGGLGAGFDPTGDWRSVYSKTKKPKTLLIKRQK